MEVRYNHIFPVVYVSLVCRRAAKTEDEADDDIGNGKYSGVHLN